MLASRCYRRPELPSVSSTSTRQYSDETLMTAEALLTISERPSTSLSQVMDTPDPEVILPGKFRTVATRLYVTLWLSLFLYTILRPWNLLVPMKHQLVLVLIKFHLFPTSLQVHQFYHLKYHSHSLHFRAYRKLSHADSHQHRTSEVFRIMLRCGDEASV